MKKSKKQSDTRRRMDDRQMATVINLLAQNPETTNDQASAVLKTEVSSSTIRNCSDSPIYSMLVRMAKKTPVSHKQVKEMRARYRSGEKLDLECDTSVSRIDLIEANIEKLNRKLDLLLSAWGIDFDA
tara:strand:- start:141 stop:524 length:384 start_codon:yes stop_codon:yes gene_type:complete